MTRREQFLSGTDAVVPRAALVGEIDAPVAPVVPFRESICERSLCSALQARDRLTWLHRFGGFDSRMGIVTDDFEVSVAVVEDRIWLARNHKFGEGARLPRELQFGLL